MDHVTGLRCRECGREFPAEALHVCDYCFGPLEVAYDYERDRRPGQPGAHRRRPPDHLALPRPAAGRRRRPGRPGRRVHPAGAGRPAGGRARTGRAVDQGRHGQPHRLVQGPGGLGGPHQGPPAGVQGGGLRLHRQPGQLRGGPRRPGGHGLGGADPPRPRGGQGHHDRRLRRDGGVGGGHLRRREPAVRRADQRAPELGLRQRQRAHLLRRGVQDPGLRGGRAAGLGGSRPRGGAHRLGQPADQGGQGLRRAGPGRPARRDAHGAGVGGPGGRLLAGGHRLRRGDRRHPAGESRRPSPSRCRSATRPTGGTRCGPSATRAGPARR